MLFYIEKFLLFHGYDIVENAVFIQRTVGRAERLDRWFHLFVKVTSFWFIFTYKSERNLNQEAVQFQYI